MRRENRGKNSKVDVKFDKIIIYAGIGVSVLAFIVFALFMYSKGLNDEVKNSTMSLGKMASIIENSSQDNSKSDAQSTQSASTEIGKSVEESKSEIEKQEKANSNKENSNSSDNSANNSNNNVNKENNKNEKANSTSSSEVNKTEKSPEANQTANIAKANNSSVEKNEDNNEENIPKELEFQFPVDGEVCKEYAKDNLIYSATLEEWTTHMGIDIKAEKTTVVKAAEEGVIKSIKNDPRYGLTIVIEHANNFQTVYSNLLTSEFVVEGEKVEKGQSIGTVGNTAVFEIADEPHLHFEILKDSLPEDPNLYLKK